MPRQRGQHCRCLGRVQVRRDGANDPRPDDEVGNRSAEIAWRESSDTRVSSRAGARPKRPGRDASSTAVGDRLPRHGPRRRAQVRVPRLRHRRSGQPDRAEGRGHRHGSAARALCPALPVTSRRRSPGRRSQGRSTTTSNSCAGGRCSAPGPSGQASNCGERGHIRGRRYRLRPACTAGTCGRASDGSPPPSTAGCSGAARSSSRASVACADRRPAAARIRRAAAHAARARPPRSCRAIRRRRWSRR